MHIESKIVHGGQHPDEQTGALSPPIYQTSTFAFRDADHGERIFKKEEEGYVYTRYRNPTIDLLAKKLALLESAESGLVYASGMAAIYGVISACTKSGDHIVTDDTIYGGTYSLFKSVIPRFGIDVTFVDARDESELESAIRDNTRFVYIESPANPTLKIIDIAKCADIAHRNNVKLCIDNTFATPYLQRPVEMGADIIVHSATKYFGGHGDIIGGAVLGTKEFIDQLWAISKDIGGSISPFNAWLVLRGLKTLAVRMDRHCENATKIAEYLLNQKKVDKVYYPGLPSDTGHEIAKRQMSRFGGMIGFDIKGGKDAGKILMNSVDLCILAVSLGDADTLIEHPASMTHSSYSEKELLACGINPGFVRLSVGLENVDDIIEDLEQALGKV